MKKLNVAIILDESASMYSIKDEIIDGFNEQVGALKNPTCSECKRPNEEELDTRVSLVTFGSDAREPIMWDRPVSEVKTLTNESYVPCGMTAMLDAVGQTIEGLTKLKNAEDKDASFLVMIISDGLENNSKTETYETIKNKIVELTGTDRWTFTYMGANQDLSKISKDMGIAAGNAAVWTNTREGTIVSNTRNCRSTSMYLGKVAQGETYSTTFYDPKTTSPATPDDKDHE